MNNHKKHFIRKKEKFKCENCNSFVQGDGYTDHCPNCLYSKHVDESVPGDRISNCKGMMIPTGITKKSGKTQIEYKCAKCGKTSLCKVAKDDNTDQVIAVSSGVK